jgi:hypothetical protein
MGARRHFPRIEVYTVIKCASRGSHALCYCVYGNLRFGNGASWGVSTLGVRRVSHTKCPNDRPQFARKVVSVPQYTRQIGVRYLDFAIDGTCPWTPGQPSSTSISLISLILQGINFSQWHALDPRCRLNLRMGKRPVFVVSMWMTVIGVIVAAAAESHNTLLAARASKVSGWLVSRVL